MMNVEKLNVGIVGVGGRPKCFISAIENNKAAKITSVCDIYPAKMDIATEGMQGINKYTDYNEMIQKGDLDAVVIGTPMNLHVPQAIIALENNIHVFSEVTASVSVQDCKALVKASNASKASYMLGENCNYMKPYMMIGEMIRAGLFGNVYYAEGEYLHNCRFLLPYSPWRGKYIYEVNGITYGTHSLGPILSWFKDDRVVKVSCMGSGHNYVDSDGKPFGEEDTCVMLAKTKMDRLIKIRLDIISNRTYNLKYLLQGTKGCYDSKRYAGEKDMIWTNALSQEGAWIDMDTLEDKYLPEIWREYGEEANKTGHGGSDYIIMTDFIDSIINGRAMPIDIHKGMDMTMPGLISQESILKGGEWITVPDSREWL